jgi:hypothetical protein
VKIFHNRLKAKMQGLLCYNKIGCLKLHTVTVSLACPEIFSEGGGVTSGYFFFGGGVQQILLQTEGRKNGNLGGGNLLVRGSNQFANE